MAVATKRIIAGGIAAATGLTLVLAPATSASAAAELDLHARLTHSASHPRANGDSEYERGNGERKVEVTVRVPGLAGRQVTLFVAGRRVGTLRLSRSGYGHREWSTEHGQFVPFASAGSKVRVWRSGTHDLVVLGRYHIDR